MTKKDDENVFRESIKLSINTLDKNAIEQPSLYEDYSRKWAEAVYARDKVKEQISIIKSEIDEEIRRNPKNFGWTAEKDVTETWLNKQIDAHEKVKEANQKLIDAQHEVNVFSSAKETLEHRKKMLEVLTDLYKGNYFTARSRSGEAFSNATEKSVEDHDEHLSKNSRIGRRRTV